VDHRVTTKAYAMPSTRRAILEAFTATAPDALSPSGITTAKQDDPSLPAPSELTLLMNRTSFGVRQEEFDVARQLGYDAWLEYQLAHEQIDVAQLEAELASLLITLAMSNKQLIELAQSSGRQGQAVDELRAATFLRQIYSARQLYEVMVEFWTNHFNVQHLDGPVRYYKTVEDRELIRRHALGRFGDLLRGDARSAAMLYYLDNYTNVASGPNENYARELLELHTMGADGGYNETDVAEVARAFTGWTLTPFRGVYDDIGFVFDAAQHDTGSKSVLGTTIPAGGGISDGDTVLQMLLDHPSTARYLATKLVRRFVSDAPPASLVSAVAATYTSSGGDIKAMLRTLLTSSEFRASSDNKFKRPVEYVMSALRTAAPTLQGSNYLRIIGEQLNTLGQLHYLWPTPDGYPDTREYWTHTSALLTRWNFSFGLVENALGGGMTVDIAAMLGDATLPAQIVDRMAERLLHRPLADGDRSALIAFVANRNAPHRPVPSASRLTRARELAGVLLGSAYFQYR
jgi:uncharacterized protein (DUF1800 family)